MTRPIPDRLEIEPERYELRADPLFQPSALDAGIDRRAFLKLAGAGVIVVLALPRQAGAQEAEGRRRGGRGGRQPAEIGAWLHVGEDGAVTVYTGKVEVGQGIRTTLAQVVAEELRLQVDAVRLVMADTAQVPFDAGTFGSQSSPVMAPQLRRVAAAARQVLVDLAAREWGVEAGAVEIASGRLVDAGSGRAIEIGTLTRGRKLVEAVTDAAAATPPGQWKVAGQPIPKMNGRDVVTGRHRYTCDLKLPGLLHGKVLRPAAFGASLESLDAREAEALEGVLVVRDGGFTGVVAPGEHQASKAIELLRAQWKLSPQPSGKELFEILRRGARPAEGGGRGGRGDAAQGSIEEGLAAADVRMESTYTIAYIAHAPLEPRAAVAEWKDGALTVWTGTQRPFGVRGELARALEMPEDRIRVIVPDTGSGYGGKHSGDAAIEAARLARAAKKPVKLVWTREEEMTWAYFRPAGVIDVKSGITRDGAITAWDFHNYNSGRSSIRPLYDIPNQRSQFHESQSPLRQGSYRALAATANHFARESHMDELARAIAMDPLELRRKNLKETRLLAVLNAAAERFGWGKPPLAPGRGSGIACGSEKGSFVASCAEVSTPAGVSAAEAAAGFRIERIVTAFECGVVLNPDNLRNQVEGAVIQGIGGALFEAIEFDAGKVTNASFARYRLPRFSDVPALETVLLNRPDLPAAGAGETPIVCVAPAIANAVAAATGERLRSMPMLKKQM